MNRSRHSVPPKPRVHLRVLEEPNSLKKVELLHPVFVRDWQNRLVESTAQHAFDTLQADSGPDSLARVGRQAMKETSKRVDELLKLAPQGALACRHGCDHCCHQSVGATPAEVIAIHFYLKQTRDLSELSVLRERFTSSYEKTRDLSSDERLSSELPCPFLEDHLCSIYELRPLSCRGVNSLNARVCENKLLDEGTRSAYFEGRLAGHSFLEPTLTFLGVSAGIQLCLSELFHLDMRPLDLNAAMQLLLSETEPGQLVTRWLKGEPAFLEAQGGDASGDRRSHSLLQEAGLVSPS